MELENSGTDIIIEEVKKKRGRPGNPAKKGYVKTGKPEGRPNSYNDKIADHIHNQLLRGRSLTAICGDENMPSLKTVYNWLDKKHPSFQKSFLVSYKTSRMLQRHLIGERMVKIADDDRKIIVTKKIKDKSGNIITKTIEKSALPWQQLQIKNLKWLAAHLQPRKFKID